MRNLDSFENGVFDPEDGKYYVEEWMHQVDWMCRDYERDEGILWFAQEPNFLISALENEIFHGLAEDIADGFFLNELLCMTYNGVYAFLCARGAIRGKFRAHFVNQWALLEEQIDVSHPLYEITSTLYDFSTGRKEKALLGV